MRQQAFQPFPAQSLQASLTTRGRPTPMGFHKEHAHTTKVQNQKVCHLLCLSDQPTTCEQGKESHIQVFPEATDHICTCFPQLRVSEAFSTIRVPV